MPNNFLIFNPNGNNELSQASYAASSTRTGGLVTGIAVKELHNKLFKQVSMMVSALGELMSDYGLDADDSNFTALKNSVKVAFLSTDRILQPVASLNILKAINTTLLPNGIIINCKGLGNFYLDVDSTATPDDVVVVQPTTGVGRWLISGANTFTTKIAGTGTIPTTGWVSNAGDYPYKLSFAITGVLSDDYVMVDVLPDFLSIANAAELAPYINEYDGGITFYSKNVPESTIDFEYTNIK